MPLVNIPFETMGLSKFIRLYRYIYSFVRHSTSLKLFNFIRIELQMLMRRERVLGMPYVLKVENTNICNFRCPVCYHNRKKHDFEGARGYGRMSVDGFRKIVDELHPWVFRINLYGFGEPFLFDEIFDMVRYASDHNIGVAITSNFNLIDSGKVDKIIDSGLEQLAISIDGVDQSSYEKYQVGGQFEKVIANIRLLQERKRERNSKYPLIDWQFLIMRHNVDMREEAIRMARELGIGIRFSRIGVDLADEKERSEWLPDEAARKELNFEDQIILGMDKVPLCSWLYRMAFINWDLGVSPCCNYYTGDKSHDFSSLRESTFSDIWNNEHYLAARRVLVNKDLTGVHPGNICRICTQRKVQLNPNLLTTR